MAIRDYDGTIKLTPGAIDEFSDKLEELLEDAGLERENRIRIKLSLEESMLRMRDRFGEEAEVKVRTGSMLRRSFVVIEHEGDIFNPLSKQDVELDDWSGSLLTAVGLSPVYSYSEGKNILKLTLPVKRRPPIITLAISILMGLLIGVIGLVWFRDVFEAVISDVLFVPVYDMWIRLLTAASGPVIFLMMLTTVTNTGKLGEEGADRGRIVYRYMVLSLLAAIIATLVAVALFHIKVDGDVDEEAASGFLALVLGIVPGNIVEPFANADTPQLLLLSFVIGNALILIGNRADSLVKFINQMNMVGLMIAEWISDMMPILIIVLVAYQMISGRTGILANMWKPILVSLLMSVIYMIITLIIVSRRKSVSSGKLISKIRQPFLITLKSGSIDEAYGQTESSCVSGLGIEKNFTHVSLPHGLVLYMPVTIMGTVTFIVYVANLNGVKVNVMWYLTLILLAVLLFEATPPVPGANLLAYIAIFNTLGISDMALIDAMVFDMVFGLFANAANQAVIQLDLVLQADRIGLLDRKRLQK